MGKLKKLGQASMSEEGFPIMINEDGKTIRVEEIAILIWLACDGQKRGDVINFFIGQMEEADQRVHAALKEVIEELIKFGMLKEEED